MREIGLNYRPGLGRSNYASVCVLALALIALICQYRNSDAQAQADIPVMLEPNLAVRTVVSRLAVPTSMAFLAYNDFLVLEKNTGKVQRVVDGQILGDVLDLAVNFGSERGLLGIALHPGFPRNPRIYLFWTCRSMRSPASPFMPDERACSDTNMLGGDTDNILDVPLLGNRVDSFFLDRIKTHIRSESSQTPRLSKRWRSGPSESGRWRSTPARQP